MEFLEPHVPEHILCGPWALKEIMKIARPSLFVIYSAWWRHGYTVNGMGPN